MKQTSENKEPKFRADYVKQYIKRAGLSYDKFLDNLVENQRLDIYIDNSTFRQYFSGAIQNVPIEILKAMANEIGVTLDYLCYNDTKNDVKKFAQIEMGLWSETADKIIENKPNVWLLNRGIKPKELSKKDYTAILNLFLDKKIPYNGGKASVIDVFSLNMLNLFICTIVYDKTILETFMQNYDKLSSAINVNKTKPTGNTDIDMTFDEIFNSDIIQNVYRNATHELHDSIDKLLETALKETFDSIKPNTTLF